MRRSFAIDAVLVVFLCSTVPGCSVFWAFGAPGSKDFEVLKTGTPRIQVENEFGTAKTSRSTSAGTVQTYEFKHGYPFWFNALRGTAHAAGDVFTLCLWEVAGSPIEAFAFKPDEVTAEVIYDGDEQVVQAMAVTKGNKVLFDSKAGREAAAVADAGTGSGGGRNRIRR